MQRILHVLDRSAGWEQRVALSMLLERLPPDRFEHAVMQSGSHPFSLGPSIAQFIFREPWRGGALASVAAAPSIARAMHGFTPDVVHAWGISAGVSSWIALRTRGRFRLPLVLELFDPLMPAAKLRLLRLLSRTAPFAMCGAAQRVRQCLVQGGVAPEACAVIRPGVDFALIQQGRRSGLREKLGVGKSEVLIAMPTPRTRADAGFDGSFAATLTHQLGVSTRLIIAGVSRERDRIIRMIHALPQGKVVMIDPCDIREEILFSLADALICPSPLDESTTAMCWAMASGAAVIASAQRSHAELAAHKVHGLLYKIPRHQGAFAEIHRLLMDRGSQLRVREAARGAAYEVFSIRRFVEQHVRLYENVLSGRSPAEGVDDPAALAG